MTRARSRRVTRSKARLGVQKSRDRVLKYVAVRTSVADSPRLWIWVILVATPHEYLSRMVPAEPQIMYIFYKPFSFRTMITEQCWLTWVCNVMRMLDLLTGKESNPLKRSERSTLLNARQHHSVHPVGHRAGKCRTARAHVAQCKLQALVYDTLPPTTAIVDYVIGLEKLSANQQFLGDAQTAVSL